MAAPSSLPHGYESVSILAERSGVVVLKAMRGQSPVALRLESGGAPESLAELAVLGTVRGRGLAHLVDFGPLPDGGRYVAREWVEGTVLSELDLRAAPERAARLVASIAEALARLHEGGFLHGDLKAANVLVRDPSEASGGDGDGDDPVLTDFGLSRRAVGPTAVDESGQRGASGSLFHLAPEELAGRGSDAASDLFALGALWVQLMVAPRVDARTFYARFPRVPYLEALGVHPGELPLEVRDLIESLVARDRSDRPVSAGWLAHAIRARLGPSGRESEVSLSELPAPRLEWPVLEGREVFVDERWRSLRSAGPGVERWTAADVDEARSLAGAIALRAALAGDPARVLDLESEVAALPHTSAIDDWARAQSAGDAALVVAEGDGTSWGKRALDALECAVAQGRAAGRRPSLVVSGARASDGPSTYPLPPLSEAVVAARLARWLPRDGPPLRDREDLEALAARIHAECGGSASRAERIVQALLDDGSIQVDGKGLRLRAGPVPERVGSSSGTALEERAASLPRDVRRIVAALGVWGEPASRTRLLALTGLDALAFTAAIQVALVRRTLQRRNASDGGAPRFALRGRPPRWTHLGLEAREREALLARAAAARNDSARPWLHLVPLFQLDPDRTLSELREELESLRANGRAELALDLGARLVNAERIEGRKLPAVLEAENLLTRATLGETIAALKGTARLERELRGTDDRAALALLARARGRAASLGQDHAAALAHYDRALALDRTSARYVLLARARFAFEQGRDEELDALVADARAGAHGDLPRIVAANLESIAAMRALRRGAVEEARSGLARSIREARELDEPAHEAADRLNLGVVERHAGRLERARVELNRAAALYEGIGYQTGLAQALAMLGATDRERGDLVRAEAQLIEAVQARERLGETTGAERARGILGLTLAERGHARAAATTLAAAARALDAAGAKDEATWLTARGQEMECRLGARPDEAIGDESQDPRIALSLGRAAWICGDLPRAREQLERARRRARVLSRLAPSEGAAFALSVLDGEPLSPSEIDSPAVREDAELLLQLSRTGPDFDAPALLELALGFAKRGRDDSAARAALGVVARADASEVVERAREVARAALQRCSVGCDTTEARALTAGLLGIPDPHTGDLAAADRLAADIDSGLQADEGLDMDVLSLLDINQRLVDQDDLPRLLGEIVESALEVTGAERGFLALEEDGEISLDLAMDSRRGDIDTPEVEVSHSVLREALARGGALRVSNATDDPVLGAAPSVAALELRSILCQPFHVQPGLEGVIYLDHRVSEDAFGERAERLLGLLAGQAALAIRQVRRLEEIRRLAGELEREVAHKESDLRAAKRALRSSGATVPVDGLVGDSAAMRAVHELLRRIAPAQLPVLVGGASGTGKELAAKALHELSARKSGPFIPENCAALPASIIESELFGYVKGAFTGADRDRPGLFERANGGTLFLDEIGELPLELQAKLLRVLETLEVRRVGSADVVSVDFRLVAATNRDLNTEVNEGRFRADLLYRLDAVRVEMPPLADRVEDIPLLIDHFLRLEEAKSGVARGVSPDVVRELAERAWPGNVRELANEIARLCVLSPGDLDDPALVRAAHRENAIGAAAGAPSVVPIAELERDAILRALEKTGGDKRRAAELLGISRAKIYQRLKDWGDEVQADA